MIPITEELKTVTKCLIQAMALVETIHPIVTGYRKNILKEINAKNEYTGEPVINPQHYYLISNEQFKTFLVRCDEEAVKNKLVHKPGCCPLLEAEEVERKAKRVFVECVLPLLPQMKDITYDSMIRLSVDKDGNYKTDKLGRLLYKSDEFIDLALNLIIPQIDKKELESWSGSNH